MSVAPISPRVHWKPKIIISVTTRAPVRTQHFSSRSQGGDLELFLFKNKNSKVQLPKFLHDSTIINMLGAMFTDSAFFHVLARSHQFST